MAGAQNLLPLFSSEPSRMLLLRDLKSSRYKETSSTVVVEPGWGPQVTEETGPARQRRVQMLLFSREALGRRGPPEVAKIFP